MSIFDATTNHIVRLRERLQSILPERNPQVDSPVDCQRMMTVDAAYLKEMAESLGTENMAAAIDAFALDVNETANRMRTQLTAGDASGARRSAHRMKGLFAQFGASDAAHLAAKLEKHEAIEMDPTTAKFLDHVPEVISAVQRATRTAAVIR